MTTTLFIFAAFVALSLFNAGAMATLQIQHYGIYPQVGRAGFVDYIRANNRAAVVPVILPALLLLLVTLLLAVGQRPPFMSAGEAMVALALNLAQLASTAIWQRRLQAEMAVSGYDETKTRLLIKTNWIRTIAFVIQAALAMTIVFRTLAVASSR